ILKGKVQQLISAFVMPLMKNYVRELEETKEVYRTAQQVKQYVSGYQALWRVYASLAAMLYSNTPRWLFWNASSNPARKNPSEVKFVAFQNSHLGVFE
ncbi:hypothetical protein, partial [Mycoplasmopsis bovis]|uniref:hypothetical protein n=1 Tax=Mycoplasmopsis bovis TaxID=28903 RepID=UPI003D27D558